MYLQYILQQFLKLSFIIPVHICSQLFFIISNKQKDFYCFCFLKYKQASNLI